MTDPGLDLALLRAQHARGRTHTRLLERIEAHLEEHDGYVAFSGGKDSTVVLHLVRQVDPAVPVAWFDSGLEYPETRAYISDLAEEWDLNLEIIPAAPTALEVLVASGAWDHTAASTPPADLFDVLVGQSSAAAHELFGRGELWGVRAAESTPRKMAYARAITAQLRTACHGCCPPPSPRRREHYDHHGGTITRRDGTTVYGPIWDWTTSQVWEYLAAAGIPVNPVYARLTALGAPETSLRVASVVDANRLEHGRITWLRRGWPDLYEQLLTRLPRLAEFV